MTGWLEEVIAGWGAAGVAFLMFLENVFPPIPSEVVLPLAGAAAANGQVSLPAALVAATAGSVLGTLPYYLAARWMGLGWLKRAAARWGRLLTLRPKDIDAADAWFDRHGRWAVLFGRLVPGVRTLISVPAGLTGMRMRLFLAATAIGTAVWSSVLIGIGYWMGQDSRIVEDVMGPVGNVILAGALAVYLWRVVTFRPAG